MFSAGAGLILVDNCEHVVDGIASFLEDLLTRDSNVTVLATSRTPIGVPGEEIAILPPLAVDRGSAADEAVELYLQRARSRAPGFQVDERGLSTIREICTRLDGLPLAIELAASQARSLPLEETLRRIREGRSLAAPATAPRRHQSLKDLVAWSHRLLRPEEQALLERMTIFRGGCTLSAIEEVCGDWGGIERWEVCDLVARLVEASLVEPVDLELADAQRSEVRYRLLETIRMYCAEEALRKPDAESTTRTLETNYLEYTNRLITVRPEERGPTRTAWIARIDPEYPNILHALDLALARGRLDLAYKCGDLLTYYWFQSGQWSVGRRWLDRILEARARSTGTSSDRVAEARFLGQSGFLTSALVRVDASMEHIDEALAICDEIEDHSAIAFVRQLAGIVTWKRMEVDIARRHLLESLRHARIAEDRGSVVAALGNLGVIESTAGRNEMALEYHEQHLAESREMGDEGAVTAALSNIAWANWALGRLELATASMREVVELLADGKNLPNLSMAKANLGEILLSAGELDAARRELIEAGRIRLEMEDRLGLATAVFSLARVAERKGRIEDAAALACAVVDGFGARKILAYSGRILSADDWKAEVMGRLDEAAKSAARDRLAGKDLAEVFRFADEWSR
ncbi:MAG: hypothetical protein R3E97_01155 [Candidatus Eisenbacteria bacterium]